MLFSASLASGAAAEQGYTVMPEGSAVRIHVGKTVLRHSEFGMKPVSAGGGTVKVKNEIGVDYRIVARAGR